MHRHSIAAATLLLLTTACGFNGTDRNQDEDGPGATATAAAGDPLASHDPAPGETVTEAIPDSEPRPMMQLQVVLERQGFGPGVIDGKMGMSTENALSGFQKAGGLKVTGEYDDATKQALARWSNIPATRVVTVPDDWGQIAFEPIPDDPAKQAEMKRLGYESLDEKLAERFHTTADVLRALNPGGRPAGMGGSSGSPAPTPTASASSKADATPAPMFRAGQQLRVPNIGADQFDASQIEDAQWRQTLVSLGVGTSQPKVARIVVSKSKGTLEAYDADDKLVALFTVTSGSSHDPLPLGTWGINGIAKNPPFAYDPSLFWDVPDDAEEQQLPPGPNGPVGVVWIDLTKEHYGIHGTSAPETIGRAQSHGCVRLTNWDAARLAQMVSGSTKVIFEA